MSNTIVVKLLKGFALSFFVGFVGAIPIVVITFPNIPEGDFKDIANWTLVERIFSVPVAVMVFSVIALLILTVCHIVFYKDE